MKQFLSVLLTFACLLAVLPLSVSARPGDIAGAVYYSDIRASVDGHPIESYNVDGYTAVCAEDLASYGFSVVWHGASRLLEIRLYTDYESTPPEYTYPEVTKPAGTYRMPYLETDIQVLAGGTIIPSWNIDGRTLVRLRDLTMFGVTVWDPVARTSAFTKILQWTMNYDITAAPIMPDNMTDISGFDLTVIRDDIGHFHLDGENAAYFAHYSLQWNFTADGADVRFSFYQNEPHLDLLRQAVDACANWDYRGNFAVTPKADIASLMTLTINGEEKTIHTVGITQGNGHVDYILTFDGCYPRAEVSDIRLTCRIPTETP